MPPHQHVEIGAEPDRDALRLDQRARVRVHEGAAAGRQHLRAALEQARDHPRLAAAEIGFAVAGENVDDAHAGGASRSRCRRRRTGCRGGRRAGGRSRTFRPPSCRPARSSGGRAGVRIAAVTAVALASFCNAISAMVPAKSLRTGDLLGRHARRHDFRNGLPRRPEDDRTRSARRHQWDEHERLVRWI